MFGFGNPFPFSLGGGATDACDSLLTSMKSQRPTILRGGGDETEVNAENEAIATAFLMAWRDTETRIAQADPRNLSVARRQVTDPDTGEVSFLSMLERWEKILNLRVSTTADVTTRRKAVHSALAGYTANTKQVVTDAMGAIFGDWLQMVTENHVSDVDYAGKAPPGNAHAFWGTALTTFDAEYPGEFNASYPWRSALCHICVHFLPPAATDQVEIDRKVNQALTVLDDILPAYMGAAISQWGPGQTDPGFYAGVSLVGLTSV